MTREETLKVVYVFCPLTQMYKPCNKTVGRERFVGLVQNNKKNIKAMRVCFFCLHICGGQNIKQKAYCIGKYIGGDDPVKKFRSAPCRQQKADYPKNKKAKIYIYELRYGRDHPVKISCYICYPGRIAP